MAYIWIKMDKKTGVIDEVHDGGSISGSVKLNKVTGTPGRKKKNDKTNDGKKIGKTPLGNQILPTLPVGDPCCYRNEITGDEWCWC